MKLETTANPQKSASRCPFSGMSATPKQALSSRLREATAEAHTVAERHPVQGRMARGAASREDYANWLEQMYHIWSAVDTSVVEAAARDERIRAMVQPFHTHAPRIISDLAFLGRTRAPSPASPGTQQLVNFIRSSGSSAAVVGPWYVMEGSNNGGRFLAKALGKALEIPGPAGLTSLDPHGEAQQPRWHAWRAALDSQSFTDAEQTAMIDAAGRTFAGLTPVFDDLPVAV